MKLKVILTIIFTILVTLIIIVGIRFKKIPFLQSNDQTLSTSTHDSKNHLEEFEKELMSRLSNLEVTSPNIKRQSFKEDSALEISALIPRGRPMEWVVWSLTSKIDQSGYYVDDCFYETEDKGCRIQFNSKDPSNPSVILLLFRSSSYFSHTAKIAVYIEDFGFNADNTTVEYLSFSEPLTVGLIPEKKLTTWTAQIANEYHKEIIIMVPMEPVPVKTVGPVLMVHYPEAKIRHILQQSIEAIPHFSGVSNFYGARVLNDSRVMSILFSEISDPQAYFLYTPEQHGGSVESLAKKYQVPFKPVDISIDTNSTVAALQDTLRHCAMVAQKTGDIIIRSKPGAAFINALKNELPVLKKNGIKLVYVSELMPKRKSSKD